ncbi:nucleotidyltransferase family protein [Rhodovulum adriaticum]|uniref:CTP:molybdopterin cytidylyltransferase MocA n=1 Tax=Rhodovulum adriaticum TaxID=35804 RepID=A0A4R2NPF8_RHOAD|nr:nucleotidyltransferase family protein [Rhodovulum adriaticum]MBK1634394.1 hypothetical protein [Rhodovulum adriaticum]TCP23238.1 CTP:molybdopterin cytidylyltransferase MocA [Rhodovulum adriaticum]
MVDLLILLPAAGRSARMGGQDKLLMPVDGEPLLRRQVRAALATGQRVLATLPRGRATARAAALAGLAGPLTIAEIDAEEGMAASLRAGAKAAQAAHAAGLMVMLPDMPEIGASHVARLARAFAEVPERPLRATDMAGIPGHPAILPARLFPALAGLRGDAGARALLQRENVRLIPLAGRAAITDLDTPADWAAWQSRQQQG